MNCLFTCDENTCPFSGVYQDRAGAVSGVYQGRAGAVSNLGFFETVGFGVGDDGDVDFSSDSCRFFPWPSLPVMKAVLYSFRAF